MGENLDVAGRESVRTPMQWSAGRNAGFSTATASRLARPITAGGFGPEHVNVADQRRDPESLLTFVSMLARRYRECPELGWSPVDVLDQPHRAVLALRSQVDEAVMITVHNLSPEPLSVPVRIGDGQHVLTDLLSDGEVWTDDDGAVELTLDGYGYRWLRVDAERTRRLV